MIVLVCKFPIHLIWFPKMLKNPKQFPPFYISSLNIYYPTPPTSLKILTALSFPPPELLHLPPLHRRSPAEPLYQTPNKQPAHFLLSTGQISLHNSTSLCENFLFFSPSRKGKFYVFRLYELVMFNSYALLVFIDGF